MTAAIATGRGGGDYLEIRGMVDNTITPSSPAANMISNVYRICGRFFNVGSSAAAVTHATTCTFSTPFKVGVHFDDMEAISTTLAPATTLQTKAENAAPIAAGDGYGYNGFYLAYWQNAC